MNYRDLKYLIALADHMHFGKAAEACFISQPGLSIQIKKLEESFGVTLIERNNKRFFFTEIGKLITEQARDLAERMENLKLLAKQYKDPFCGELYLGIIPTLAPYFLPHIIPKLSQTFPHLMLYLIEDTTMNLLKKLSEGKLDCALLALPIEGDFVINPLFNEAFYLAVPISDSLSNKKMMTFDDLKNKSLLLLEEGHCLRDQALAICQETQAIESKSFRATSLETLRHMVAAGVGITLIPELACQSNERISYLPFVSKNVKRAISMIWRRSSVKKVLLEQFMAYMKERIAEISQLK